MSGAPNNNGRDQRGRFGAGNPGGKGGPHRRAAELRRAAEEAVTPEHVAALVRKATRMGLEGNLTATRLVLERVCGRASEAPATAADVEIQLPRLKTAADCGVALEHLVDGVCNGTMDRGTAQTLIAGVQARLRAIETTDFERRLAELELAARQAAAHAESASNKPDPRFQ